MKLKRTNPDFNIFVTSDLHFGHANILGYANRPFADVHEMNKALTENWNAIVEPRDEVFILGDFAFQNHAKYAEKLNGRKYLILGNHDKPRDAYQAESDGVFEKVDNYCRLTVNGQTFILFHYAIRQWDKKHHKAIHLYGHSHGQLPAYHWSFDVGVDVWDYKPISIQQVLDHVQTLEGDFKHHE